MKKLHRFIICCSLCFCCGTAMAVVDIVPKPFFAEETGNVLMLGPKIRVFARTAELESVVRVWKESLCKPYAPGVSETAAGFRRIVSDATLPGIVLSAKARNADVCLSVDAKLAAEEYVLEISSEGIAIRGGSPSGVRWGLQTLSQVLIGCANEQPGNETLRLSGLRIADKPRFAYRGAMLDCCRHFFTVEEVKSFIDVMFLHKLNTFHWHLTDDQGWRIEIRKYPFLTQIGSMRKETLIGHIQKSKEYDGTPYGGYYTQDEIRENRGTVSVPGTPSPWRDRSVEENLEYLNPPVKTVFADFVSRIRLIDPDLEAALEELKGKIENDVFMEWVDALKSCLYDRSLKTTLTPIVAKLSDMRIVNAELEYLVFEPRKEFITMVVLAVGNIPLLYFLNQSWYDTLMHTIPGQIMLAVTGAIIFVSTACVIKLTKPIEYRT